MTTRHVRDCPSPPKCQACASCPHDGPDDRRRYSARESRFLCVLHSYECVAVGAQEDARLVQLVSGYGAANWSVIAEVRDVLRPRAVLPANGPPTELQNKGDVTGIPAQTGRSAIEQHQNVLCADAQSLGGNPPRNGKSCRLRYASECKLLPGSECIGSACLS